MGRMDRIEKIGFQRLNQSYCFILSILSIHVNFPSQRSLSVERLKRANRMAMIKNRKTIFGSFHPDISKWWCSGVILKRRRPVPVLRRVILKNETCKVTE